MVGWLNDLKWKIRVAEDEVLFEKIAERYRCGLYIVGHSRFGYYLQI